MLDSLEIFYGRVTNASARVYVRMRDLQGGGSWTLSGHIRGPRCNTGRTLPATFPLRDLGAGTTLLAEASLTEPCCWSRDLPALYDVHVELRENNHVRATLDRSLGIRRFGVAGRNLTLDGKRWVLRGVGRGFAYPRGLAPFAAGTIAAMVAEQKVPVPFSPPQLTAYREASAVMIIDTPANDLCETASETGVMLVACIRDPSRVVAELHRLSRWAAVAVVILPPEIVADEEISQVAPNILLAQHFPANNRIEPASWAELLFVEVTDDARFARNAAGCPLPIVAVRRLNESGPLDVVRGECDRLQRDLAPHGDFAGYVVFAP